MQQDLAPHVRLLDCAPERDTFREEVSHGLQQPIKELPAKFLYDERGSRLFEQIAELDEYYLTRTEIAILAVHAREMTALIGPQCLLIEYGSGSSTKTIVLLDTLQEPAGYVPIDISKEQLLLSTRKLAAAYPNLEVFPVYADYTSDFELPVPPQPVSRRVVYYPGSTIGNFDPEAAQCFLTHIAEVCGQGGGLLIGVDLKKDPELLHRAYNDRKGITAAFNLNLLVRINRELGADFQPDQFRHYAFYNPQLSRIEMHLVSLTNQTVHLDNQKVRFKVGESIWTESSYKYTPDEFEHLAAAAGFAVEQVWTDRQQLFSVQYLRVR